MQSAIKKKRILLMDGQEIRFTMSKVKQKQNPTKGVHSVETYVTAGITEQNGTGIKQGS